jgi:hypothetical protein
VKTFEDAVHRLLVQKRPGKEALSLLDSEGGSVSEDPRDTKEKAEKTLWSSLKTTLLGTGSAAGTEKTVKKGERI